MAAIDLNDWPDQAPELSAPPPPPVNPDDARFFGGVSQTPPAPAPLVTDSPPDAPGLLAGDWQTTGKRIIGDVARRLLGPPNDALSSETQLRFGTYGSIAVEIGGEAAGTWYDHERKTGGGTALLIQHVGGIPKEDCADWVKREIGVEIAQAKRRTKLNIVATYDYRAADGSLRFQVCRLDPKDFRQRAPDGKWSIKGIERVPYRLPQVLGADPALPVFDTEGEKDADRLASLGCVATTSPGGAKKWQRSYNSAFAGRHVVLLPDNDEVGREHMEAVAAQLAPVAASVRILDLSAHPPAGGDPEALARLIRDGAGWQANSQARATSA